MLIIDKLVAFFVSPFGHWVGIAAAGAIVIGGYTWTVDHGAYKRGLAHAQTKIITKVEKAQAKEVIRRETVLQRVQVRSQADVKALARQATKIVALQEETNRASQAHDHDVCLDRAAVMRLAAIGPGQD